MYKPSTYHSLLLLLSLPKKHVGAIVNHLWTIYDNGANVHIHSVLLLLLFIVFICKVTDEFFNEQKMRANNFQPNLVNIKNWFNVIKNTYFCACKIEIRKISTIWFVVSVSNEKFNFIKLKVVQFSFYETGISLVKRAQPIQIHISCAQNEQCKLNQM